MILDKRKLHVGKQITDKTNKRFELYFITKEFLSLEENDSEQVKWKGTVKQFRFCTREKFHEKSMDVTQYFYIRTLFHFLR